jgi:NAD(P)H-hydrate repair Nnr-like enzyme with NAD(P)H-hydrate dehydratase domain
MHVIEAASVAARTNRLAGYYAEPTAATQVMDIVSQIPKALHEVRREAGKARPMDTLRHG